MTDSTKLIIQINELLSSSELINCTYIENIIGKIEHLKNSNTQFKRKFNNRLSGFKQFKATDKYQNGMKVLFYNIKNLYDIFNLAINISDTNPDDYDIYFCMLWLYKQLPLKSKNLLNKNARMDSVFNFYYSIINFAYTSIQLDEEDTNANKEFNLMILSIKKEMDDYSDFYLYELYKNENFEKQSEFLKKVFCIVLNNILNLIKNDINSSKKDRKIVVKYNIDLKTLLFDNLKLKNLTDAEFLIVKNICNNLNDLSTKYKSNISKFNKKIKNLLSNNEQFILYDKNQEKYVFNIDSFDIMNLEIN